MCVMSVMTDDLLQGDDPDGGGRRKAEAEHFKTVELWSEISWCGSRGFNQIHISRSGTTTPACLTSWTAEAARLTSSAEESEASTGRDH